MRPLLCCSIAVAALVAVRADAKPCWRDREPRTLLDVFLEADIVAVGALQNAVEPNNDLPNGQVEIRLDDVLKSHALIKDVKKIVRPRHIAADKSVPSPTHQALAAKSEISIVRHCTIGYTCR